MESIDTIQLSGGSFPVNKNAGPIQAPAPTLLMHVARRAVLQNSSSVEVVVKSNKSGQRRSVALCKLLDDARARLLPCFLLEPIFTC